MSLSKMSVGGSTFFNSLFKSREPKEESIFDVAFDYLIGEDIDMIKYHVTKSGSSGKNLAVGIDLLANGMKGAVNAYYNFINLLLTGSKKAVTPQKLFCETYQKITTANSNVEYAKSIGRGALVYGPPLVIGGYMILNVNCILYLYSGIKILPSAVKIARNYNYGSRTGRALFTGGSAITSILDSLKNKAQNLISSFSSSANPTYKDMKDMISDTFLYLYYSSIEFKELQDELKKIASLVLKADDLDGCKKALKRIHESRKELNNLLVKETDDSKKDLLSIYLNDAVDSNQTVFLLNKPIPETSSDEDILKFINVAKSSMLLYIAKCSGIDWTIFEEFKNEMMSNWSYNLTIQEYYEYFDMVSAIPPVDEKDIISNPELLELANFYNISRKLVFNNKIFNFIFESGSIKITEDMSLHEKLDIIEKYVANNKDVLHSLNFIDEVELHIIDLVQCYIGLTRQLNFLMEGSEIARIKQNNMLGGSVTTSVTSKLTKKTLANYTHKLLLRMSFVISVYKKILKVSGKGTKKEIYGVSSTPYRQNPTLSSYEKEGIRNMMKELSDLASLISIRVIHADDKKMPPYSMYKELEKIGITLDDDYLNKFQPNDLTNRLKKDLNTLINILNSMILYYEDMLTSVANNKLKNITIQLKGLRANLENAILNSNNKLDDYQKTLKGFFSMKNSINPVDRNQLVRIDYGNKSENNPLIKLFRGGGGEEKKEYATVSSKLQEYNYAQSYLLNTISQTIDGLNNHVSAL